MIIHGSYYGDKADVWSTGCILLELVAGHEKFCDVWMTAYDYEVLKDKEKFTDTINDTLDQLPEMLNFSPELNSFILKFLELSQSKRPSTAQLCSHAWLDGLVDEELKQRSMLKLSTEGTGLGSGMASSLNSSKYPHPFLGTGGDSPSQSLRNLLPDNGHGDGATEEDHRLYVEMIFANLSERERKHMQEYILHHKNDGPDQHHAQMHLPPIVPSTPNIGNAKKILRKGNELANANYSMDVHSPLGRGSSSYSNHSHSSNSIHIGGGAHGASGHNLNAAFSPEYSASPMTPVRMPGSSRSNSISPLPGVSENEVEDFEIRRAHDKFHTPQHSSQHKLVSNSFKSSLSAQAASHPSSRHAEPKQLLFASQSDRDLQDDNPLTLSSSSH